jgi:hypothetical protein
MYLQYILVKRIGNHPFFPTIAEYDPVLIKSADLPCALCTAYRPGDRFFLFPRSALQSLKNARTGDAVADQIDRQQVGIGVFKEYRRPAIGRECL